MVNTLLLRMDMLKVLLTSFLFTLVKGVPHSSFNAGEPNPCHFGSSELYHAYPGDSSRYIQCSEWGQSFIKYCGAGKTWKQQLKTCVKSFTTSAPIQSPLSTQASHPYTVNNYDYYQYQNPVQNYDYYQDQKRQTNHVEQTRRDVDYNNWYGPQNDPSTGDMSAQGNSLWNRYETLFSNIDRQQPANQGNYRLQGQVMSGETNIHQSGGNHQQYGADNHQQMSRRGAHAAGNSLWNRYGGGVNMQAQPTYTSAPRTYYPPYPSTPAPTPYPSQYQQAYGQDTPRRYVASYQHQDNSRDRQMNTQNQWNYHSQSANKVPSMLPRQMSSVSSQANNNYSPVMDSSKMKSAQRQAPSFNQPEGSFDVPEICKNSELRYVASPSDSTHFYECVRGKATIKSCPGDQLWVQPLRKCVDVSDNSNSLPSHNPCISSDARFHPYPTDPSKYVECQSWYRVYVWKCKGGLWTQKSQKCSNHHSEQTPVGQMNIEQSSNIERSYQPQNTVVYKQNKEQFNGYCQKRNFYYAHENEAKYIQCDEFGKWFIKDCPLNTTWDDSLKVCVLSLIPDPLPSRDDNNNNDAMTDMNSVSRQLPANFDGTAATYPCPANYAWDVTRNTCVAISLSDYLPPCTKGYMWDEYQEDCVPYADPMDVEEFPDAQFAQPNCPPTYQWDLVKQMCVVSLQETAQQTGSMILDALSLSSMDYGADYDQHENLIQYQYTENICNTSSDQFYFAIPGQPQHFLQCDQFGAQYRQSCGLHKVWNDDIKTCVHHVYEQELPNKGNMMNGGNGDHNMMMNGGNNDEAVRNPTHNHMHGGSHAGQVCLNSDVTYHSDSSDRAYFIMCHNYVGYRMACPYGSYWQDDIVTCNWPEF